MVTIAAYAATMTVAVRPEGNDTQTVFERYCPRCGTAIDVALQHRTVEPNCEAARATVACPSCGTELRVYSQIHTPGGQHTLGSPYCSICDVRTGAVSAWAR